MEVKDSIRLQRLVGIKGLLLFAQSLFTLGLLFTMTLFSLIIDFCVEVGIYVS